VQREVRLVVTSSWQYHGLSVTGSGGVHLIHNAGQVTGANATRWLVSIGLKYGLAWERALP